MDYDLAVIGAGWAGFNAALRVKELGLKVVLIEKDQLGGTCLNRGCIPTKTIIQSAKVYSLTRKSSVFGIEIQSSGINFNEIQARKDKVTGQLRQGMNFMLKGIDFMNAKAELLGPNVIRAGGKELSAKFILVACGSKPLELADLRFDHKKIVSSDDILNLKELPRTLLIIGGGVIGCEFASIFAAFGVKVSVVEKMPQLLPGEDKEIARKLESIFKKKGIGVNTNTDALNFSFDNYDLVLLCVGRVPNLTDLGLENAGVNQEKGRILTNEYLRTNIPGIYAAGDCTGKTMLAHFAAYQGYLAAENIANPSCLKKADNNNIPNCIFTDPEIASVSLNEEKAKTKRVDIKINKFDFLGLGMARIMDETEGFIKIISDRNTGQVLGASIIGPRATELIATLTLAVSARLKLCQIRETIFAHPTISESIGEALK
jgi:dihydrolipoamide dehydrogenase